MKTLTLRCLTAIAIAALVAHAQVGGHGGGFGGGGYFGFAGRGGGHYSAPAHFAAPSFHAAPSVSFGARATAPTRNFAVAPAPSRFVAPKVANSGSQLNLNVRLSSNWHGNISVSLLGEPYYYPGYGDYSYAPSYDYGDSATTYSNAAANDSVVVDVQKQLAREGSYRGPSDGILGSSTRSAIAAYQRDHRLPVSGQINTSLIESLGLA